MKPNSTKPNNVSNRFSAEKNKIFLAVGLIAVMAFMWTRVLSKEDSPQTASAAAAAGILEAPVQREVEISYIQLPVISGRNDTIKDDFFSTKSWDAFVDTSAGHGEPSNYSTSAISGKALGEIGESLKLQAVINVEGDKGAEAFIDNNLVSVGSKLAVDYNGRVYEFIVDQILDTTVILSWKELKLVVKM